MNSMILKTALLAAALSASGLAGAAEMDAKQVTIAAKALGFLTTKAPAGAKVVVTAGAAPVAAVQAALPGAFVAAGDAAPGAYAVFVSSAAEGKKALAKGTVTVGNDVACVDAGGCVIAVETTPKVTIYVSKAAASAAGVEFDPNFKMMVTEK
ncbi:hypothetical protein FBZ89_101130 [Nitrospirillum amazonense]|uniref:Uncharacterized protein n=1 Tax=Nitrospirillum amazonense TaxID=28077 RepID=A0A560FS88_9PROT|nr:hypothetical protein [Nitrospirillum amazonense]TWB24505.1 hypothetical protein FBZ89_101130 [Nitrospirillum amazonense]